MRQLLDINFSNRCMFWCTGGCVQHRLCWFYNKWCYFIIALSGCMQCKCRIQIMDLWQSLSGKYKEILFRKVAWSIIVLEWTYEPSKPKFAMWNQTSNQPKKNSNLNQTKSSYVVEYQQICLFLIWYWNKPENSKTWTSQT